MVRSSRLFSRAAFTAAACVAVALVPFATPVNAATGSVTAVSPALVANTGSAVAMTFTTSSAATSPATLLSVTLSGPAGTTITDSAADSVDTTAKTVTATFDLRGAAPGLYGVRIADATDGAIDDYSCTSCLRVLASPPSATSVAPTTRGAGAAATTFTISGSNLFNGVTVRFLRAGTPDATISYPATGSLTVAANNASVSGPLAVGAGAVPGTRDVEVTNTDGQHAMCAACLTISAAPTYVSLLPGRVGQGTAGRALTLTGADFQPSMTATFYKTGSTSDTGGVTTASVVLVDSSSATITVNVADTSVAADEPRDLVLTNTDGGTTRTAGALVVTPEPTVTGLSPSTLDGGAVDEQLVVTGTNLSTAASDPPVFAFSGAGVVVSAYTPDATTPSTKGYLTVSLTPGLATAARTVTVTNPDGGRSTSGSAFTPGPTPTVTSVSPQSLGRGVSGRSISITGSNFDSTNGVSVTIDGITLTNVVATSATTITAVASAPADATVGTRDVSILNVGAGRRGRATCTGCFAVDSFSVDGVNPSAVLNSASYSIDVTGSGFTPGTTTTATLTRNPARAGQDPIEFGGTVSGDGTTFTGTVDLRDMAPGTYTVRLTDGSGAGTCSCTFYLLAEADPTVTSVTPSAIPRGSVSRVLSVKGTHLTRGTDVTFGTGVTKAGPVTFVSSTEVTVAVNVAADAPLGATTVTVLVPGFGADTQAQCAACLTVTAAPAVSKVSPATRGQGAPAMTASVTGTGFAAGATLSFGDGVTVTNVVVASATSITATVTVGPSATPGPRVVTVTNPDGGTGTCACFAVTAAPAPTSVSPASGGQGRTGIAVTVAGTGFQDGLHLSFGSDVTVTNVTRSGDTATATLDLSHASTGAHQVSVSNVDGGAGVCECTFTVNLVPTVSSVTPSSRGAGATGQALTVTGTNFSPAAALAFGDPRIAVVSTTVQSATTISAVVSVAADTPPAAYGVTVTNGDTGEAGTCAACFTVNPKPALATFAATVQRNRTGRSLTLSGSGFQVGTVAADLGDGVVVTHAEATSSSSVSVTFDVGNAAALGAHDVTVTNPDGGPATCTGCLTVTTPRVFTLSGTGATPVSGQSYTVTVTAHVNSDPSSAVDTAYTGTPLLSAAADSHFGTVSCGAASNGVSTCPNVVFGDLGPASLNASGTGGDADLGGTAPVTVQPTALAFSPAPPGTVAVGSPVTFTVRPVAGVSGASIDGYAAARTATITDGTTRTVSLTCPGAVCSFDVTFDSAGAKTVSVSDTSTPSRSTPAAHLVARIATSITSFTVTPRTVTAYDIVTVRGVLRDANGAPVPGVIVRIYLTTYHVPWYRWADVRTTSTGVFSIATRPAHTASFKPSYVPAAGAPYLSSGTYALSVGVATRVVRTAPASGTRVASAHNFTVRGYTYPAKPGVRATLYWRRPDGRVVGWASAVIGSDGRFAITRAVAARGTYTLYVAVPAASGNLTGRSAFFTITVT